jgi:hypothetical protein
MFLNDNYDALYRKISFLGKNIYDKRKHFSGEQFFAHSFAKKLKKK